MMGVMKMSKHTYRLFLVVAGSLLLLLLLCSTPNVYAQNREASKKRARRGGLDSSSRARVTERASIRRTTIEGKIRWKKTLGVPFVSTHRPPCVFIVIPLLMEGAPGTLPTPKEIKSSYAFEGELYEEQDYYFCKYRLMDLPRDVEITVTPEFEYPSLATSYWAQTTQSFPPQGHQRVILGSQKVMLTNKLSTATVDFEVAMRPLPTPPR